MIHHNGRSGMPSATLRQHIEVPLFLSVIVKNVDDLTRHISKCVYGAKGHRTTLLTGGLTK